MPDISPSIQNILGPDGLLVRSLKGFEFRSSQLQMANLIMDSLQKNIPAIVEAGTGTGKTFGYLLPLILSGKKAVISTGTKNLQEQIFFKDIPLLQKAASLNIDAMIMKGRKNYLCLYKYHQFFSSMPLFKTDMKTVRKKLQAWLEKTEFADRAELPWLADDDILWDALSSGSDQCLGANCMFIDDCFLGKLRSKAARTRIIIVNHHLFFADLKVKQSAFGEIIPRFQAVVFDEAHNIEEIATFYLGESLSPNQLIDFADDIGHATRDIENIDKDKLKKYLTAIKTGSEHLKNLFYDQKEKGLLDQKLLTSISEGPAMEIRRSLKYFQKEAGFSDPDSPVLQPLALRAGELDRLLAQVLKKRDENWLSWYEKRKKSLMLYISPLDISKQLREVLYEKVKTVVFTSATISTNGNFDYFRTQLGLPEETLDGIYPSHFEFGRQALMYIPKDMSTPDKPDFGLEITERIVDILKRTEGRALVLFTSYHNLNLAYRNLQDKIPYTIFKQGDAPRSVLLDSFKRDICSVLLATGSFWQGVDVPGEALSCLIIDKLPFASPAEPLVAARIDAIRRRGGNPFMDYQLPLAIISLKQGLGRLIRKISDRGILSVLDIRILQSRYGRFFLDSLPKIPITHELPDIDKFFETMKGEQNAPQAVESDFQQTR